MSAANTTNTVQVEVINNGTPALSATNSFSVIVNPVVAPSIGPISVTGKTIQLTVDGTQGPNYMLETSTNLTTWQTVLTTNSTPMPLTLAYTNSTSPGGLFFRFQVGP